MNIGKYVAVSAAVAQESRLDTITNNLANANTTGFKRDRLLFETYMNGAESDLNIAKSHGKLEYVGLSSSYTDQTQGPIVRTGNKLDVAIMGKGFFLVDTPEGMMGTRNGNFRIGEDGSLQTSEGFKVLQIAENGTYDGIQLVESGVAAGSEYGEDLGDLEISSEGGVFFSGSPQEEINGEPRGKITLFTVEGAGRLEKYKNGLYKLNNSSPIESDGIIKQGFLEGSNVNTIQEMTRMIDVTRSFESYQKIIQAFNEMDRTVIAKVGEV